MIKTTVKVDTRELGNYIQNFQQKVETLIIRLLEIGVEVSRVRFASSPSLTNDVSVSMRMENGVGILSANGEDVVFIEFGAGARYGYGHEWNSEFGFGPGTYPGKGHWNDPKGWNIPREKKPVGETHTYGNPPAMAMYTAYNEMIVKVTDIAREIFR